MQKKLIYFLCTGNSCRSQMAEGWGKYFANGTVDVESAGVEAHGLNPRAVAVMREVGVDISQHESKLIDAQTLRRADVVVTLCGDANDRCPVTPPSVKRLHIGFPDPAQASGSEAEVMDAFRRVRDAIGDEVRRLLADVGGAAQ